MDFPRITCLMLTKGDPRRVQSSIDNFRSQTYKNKHLLILSKEVVRATGNDITVLTVPQRLTMGEMRNLSVEAAASEIVCQWDDDDLSSPFRLTTQYHALLSGYLLVGYSRYIKYFRTVNEAHLIHRQSQQIWKSIAPSSVMFKKELFYKMGNKAYNEQKTLSHEDVDFLQRVARNYRVGAVGICQFVSVFDGENLWSESFHREDLTRSVESDPKLLTDFLRSVKVDFTAETL